MAIEVCHVCTENPATSKVKACCSHLVPLCDDCDRKVVMHDKCPTCQGKDTRPAKEVEEENRRCLEESYLAEYLFDDHNNDWKGVG